MSNPTLKEIQEAADENQGWCTNCEEWTHDNCEPDARKYECPECEHNTVYGAEELIVMGLVDLSED
jgi:Zn finger protein HypA/HybF involved in hydrogenase expression